MGVLFFEKTILLSQVYGEEKASLPLDSRHQVIQDALDYQEELDDIVQHKRAETPPPPFDPRAVISEDDLLPDRLPQFLPDEFSANPRTVLDRDEVVREALNEVEIGLETYAISYREPGLMKDQGILSGLYGSYTYRTRDNQQIQSFKDAWRDRFKINKFMAEGRLARGKVDYESDDSGTLDGLPYYTFELRGLLAYEMPMIPSGCITPYFGVGFRYLKDDSGGKTTTTGHWSYDRESRYIYIPIGLEITKQLKNKWSVGLTCEYDIFLFGKQKSHLEDGGAWILDDGQYYALDTLENDQEEGFGLRGSLKIMRQHEKWDFVFEPFVRYWSLKDSLLAQWTSLSGSVLWYSDPAYRYPIYGYEPENHTTEYGFRLGVNY